MLKEDIRWSRCDIKSVALLANTISFQEAYENGLKECIFVRNGLITEGSHSNIFFVIDGTLFILILNQIIYFQVLHRKNILRIAQEAGINIREEAVPENRLRFIQEAFITNTSAEVTPVIDIGGNTLGDGFPGPVTRLILEKFDAEIRCIKRLNLIPNSQQREFFYLCTNFQTHMSNMNLSEQEQIRRESLDELRKLGIDPYPAAEYKTNAFAQDILDNYSPEKNNFQDVCLAGRIMSRRIMGNASFAELMDSSGRIQIYVRRDDICPGEDKTMYNTVFKHLLDIGDIIGVKGHVFKTQMGETTVHVNEFTVLSKSVHPLPVVKEKDGILFDAVTDPEMRYRQRYVDLIVNPQVRDVFRKRTQIIQSMRELFNSRGYLEVETPILQPIPGGATARPFKTHHNALDIPLYLRIANELYLKRLIVGGFEGVYEFAKDFRNEGMDRTHNPEFTVMEIYIAYKDYNWMMTFTEEIIKKAALDLHGKTEIVYGDKTINLNPPFKRISMLDSIKENTGIDISGMDEAGLIKVCDNLGIAHDKTMGKGQTY